jgi:hypothetical protein
VLRSSGMGWSLSLRIQQISDFDFPRDQGSPSLYTSTEGRVSIWDRGFPHGLPATAYLSDAQHVPIRIRRGPHSSLQGVECQHSPHAQHGLRRATDSNGRAKTFLRRLQRPRSVRRPCDDAGSPPARLRAADAACEGYKVTAADLLAVAKLEDDSCFRISFC